MKSCCFSLPCRSLVVVLSVCIITLAGQVVATPLLVGTNHADEKQAADVMTTAMNTGDKFIAMEHRTAGRVAAGVNYAVSPAKLESDEARDLQTCTLSCNARYLYYEDTVLLTCGTSDNIDSSVIGDYFGSAGDCYENSCCADDNADCCIEKPECVPCFNEYLYYSNGVLSGCGDTDNVDSSKIYTYNGSNETCFDNSCCADDVSECCIFAPSPVVAPSSPTSSSDETCSEVCTAENVFNAVDVLLECRSLDNVADYMIDNFTTPEGECIETSCCADEVSECCQDASPTAAPAVAPTSPSGSCETCTANFIFLSNKMIETCGTLDNVQLTLFGNYESEEGDCYQDSCCADDITECCVNKPGPALAPVETPRGESIVTAPTLAPAPKTPTAKAKAKTSPPPALLISSAKVNGGGANAIYYWLVGIALFVIAY